MFHPSITLFFWALLFFSPAPAPQDVPSVPAPEMQQTVLGDSTVFRALSDRLARHRTVTHPEKLYLHLDRTLFRPGETLWFNAYLRNAGDLLPAIGSQVLYVQLLDPRGAVLSGKTLLALDGTAPGEFDLPASLPGGMYRIKAWSNWMLNTGDSFERTITLQKTVLPNVNLKLEFERKAFGPGDEVVARFDASGLDNRPLAGRDLRFNVNLGGHEFSTGTAKTDANGRAYLRFSLPAELTIIDGLLNVQLEHNGQPEAISRPVPIVLNKIDLQFFPEGGDLVEGIPGRVAFKAVNEFGKPADVAGYILDDRGRQITRFESFHDGMGAFDFAPQPGRQYSALLSRPTGIMEPEIYLVPTALTEGYTLRLLDRSAKQLRFEVSGTRPGKVYLTGMQRDQLFYFREINLDQNATTVEVPVESLEPGITCFTLFDDQTREQAERLVFVNRDRGLQIEIKADKDQYLPRDKVRLDLRVRDCNGNPVQGAFSLAVADEKLLTFADDKQGQMLASLLLEQDLRGKIEEPNFYFDTKEPKADQALDYLLMTQGWRRFDWKATEPLVLNYPHLAEPATVEGYLLHPDGRPWANKTLKLYPNGPAVRSDKSGRFSFQRIDLSQFSHLQLSNGQYVPVNQYQQNLYVYMSGREVGYATSYAPEQSGQTLLTGVVADEGGEPLIGASVKVLNTANQFVAGQATDFNGAFRMTLSPGTYNVECTYVGFSTARIVGVQVRAGQINQLNATMEQGTLLQDVMLTAYKVPLIEQDKTTGGQTLSSDQIKNLPTRNVNTIMATTAAKPVDADDVRIGPGRANTTVFFIDGVQVTNAPMPEAKQENVVMILADEVPADFANRDELALAEVVVTRAPRADTEDLSSGAIFKDDDIMPRRSAAAKSRQEQPYGRPAFTRAREFYSPRYQSRDDGAAHNDYRSTLYWNPAIRTDKSGKATVEFFTSDAITNFRATLEGIGDAGVAGHGESKFFVEKPVSIQVKTPPYVISGDLLRLDVALSNKTAQAISGVLELNVPAHFELRNEAPATVRIEAGETKVVALEYRVGRADSPGQLLGIRFRAPEAFDESFEAQVPTLDRGFPARQVMTGQGAQNVFNLNLLDPVEGTLGITLTAYPNALSDVLKGMERMLQQPGGCFEQVSSSNYPNLLVLDLLRQTGQTNPELETRANALLASGYEQLAAYECKNGGFDWWGRDPAHEGLTAYGIMEFKDMSRVYKVDQGLIDRSVRWLKGRRDGEGGWKRREDWHGWQSDGVLGAYIAWAVCEAGFGQQFQTEINASYQQAVKSDDPYQLALLANALIIQRDPRANELLTRLLKKQESDGSWIGSTHSVMYGGGNCFRIETTSLVALALMKKQNQPLALDKAMRFIMASKNEYGYGSTQSTVLALKALVQFTQKSAGQGEHGTLVVQIDGKRVVEKTFSSDDPQQIEIAGLQQFVTNNQPRIEVFFEGKTVLPFDIEVKYASRQPRNAAGCPLVFSTWLERANATVGQTVRLSASINNSGATPAASPMIVLGIPAGLSLQPWQLKKLVDEKKCDFYEIWDGYAVFHFERLDPGDTRRLDLDLRADIAGQFEAPASQAFLYYQNDMRVWSKPEALHVQ